MCMKRNNNRLLRGVAAVLCLALMFLTMSGMAMATDMEDAPAGGAPESTPENVSTSRMVASSIPTVMFFASLFGFSMRAGGGFMRGGKR